MKFADLQSNNILKWNGRIKWLIAARTWLNQENIILHIVLSFILICKLLLLVHLEDNLQLLLLQSIPIINFDLEKHIGINITRKWGNITFDAIKVLLSQINMLNLHSSNNLHVENGVFNTEDMCWYSTWNLKCPYF